MELSDPDSSHATNRRKSGRAVKKPDFFQEDPTTPSTNSAKRKRPDRAAEEDENVGEDASGEESVEESDGEADEEELKEKRRRASKAKKGQNKPAAKKPKTLNGLGKLALRPAPNGVKKASKPRKAPPRQSAAEEVDGLYAEVFAGGHTQDAVAAEWISKYEEHNANAMRDLVNFVLRCTGCNLQVDVHEIEDPDNIPSKLSDLQDEYQAQKITDYPLISKSKGNATFRATLTGFFDALINTAHVSSLLYNDIALIENIQAWVTTTSSSAIRPFRHTATVISLAIVSTLCNIANEVAESSAKTLRQMEGEKKKKAVNKGRIAALQEKISEGDRKRETLEGIIKDLFDTVFVHRYRDVDPKIRADCCAALGEWIMTLPDVFFEGQYLRYLGWVLSDTSAPTRAEVIKQLKKLFKNKDKIGGLRTFTERFRPRLVEMATRDAEASVRASTVELLDLIREAGFLEPDDVDSVGRLVFDSEPRVRKAVVGFFAENINDLYESKIEELGTDGEFDDALGEAADDDFDSPRRAWLKLKCLVEVLRSYDSEDNDDLPSQIERGAPGANDSLTAAGVDSRFSLAAQVLYDEIPEIRDWEIMAGYLLFDHSEIPE
ncbi:MAG: hypothetical protein M1830_003611, partial [Pleopsidium flavum]